MQQIKFNKDNTDILKDKKIAIVVAYFYQEIGDKLLAGATKTLQQYGAKDENVVVFQIPGAFEVPLMVKKLAQDGYDGIITLGAVIRGETPHFDFVAGECARGVAHASYDYDIPIAFGVLTTDNMAQTLNRSGGKKGNKGVESAMAMIEMLFLLDS